MGDPTDHREWVAKAEEDRRVAQYLLDTDFSSFAAILFHAQQAVEKYLKAWLIQRQFPFARSHDIGYLLQEIQKCDYQFALDLKPAVALSIYAVDMRYPDNAPEVTQEEARRGVDLMNSVIDQISPTLS